MKKMMAVSILCLVTVAFTLPAFSEGQPHMQAALEALRQAEKHLSEASRDKGGHRARALNHVRQAIGEVERGIQYDNTHPDRDDMKRR